MEAQQESVESHYIYFVDCPSDEARAILVEDLQDSVDAKRLILMTCSLPSHSLIVHAVDESIKEGCQLSLEAALSMKLVLHVMSFEAKEGPLWQ